MRRYLKDKWILRHLHFLLDKRKHSKMFWIETQFFFFLFWVSLDWYFFLNQTFLRLIEEFVLARIASSSNRSQQFYRALHWLCISESLHKSIVIKVHKIHKGKKYILTTWKEMSKREPWSLFLCTLCKLNRFCLQTNS